MHGFICMDSKTLSHGQQLQRIESHIEESFHSALLHVLALSLCIFIRSPYMSSFISPLETTESQNLLAEKCWGIVLFFPLPRESLWLEKGPAGVFPLRKVKGAAGIQNHPDLHFYLFLSGPTRAQEIWWINLQWKGTLCHGHQIRSCAQDVVGWFFGLS